MSSNTFTLFGKHMSVPRYPTNRSTSENLFLYSTTKQTVPTSQRPPLPLLSSSPPPLLLSKTKKAHQKKRKRHSQPSILNPTSHLFSKRYTHPLLPPSTIGNTPPPPPLLPEPCISATATRKESKTCSVTYLTTRVKKLHLHLHLQGQWTTLFRNFYL